MDTRRKIRILHTSDIHLDNDIGSGAQRSAAQIGLESIVDAAIDQSVDLVLLAGDLFDHNRIKEPCLSFVDEQFSRLECPLVMISGNHDCLADYSIYTSYDPEKANSHITFLREEKGAVCFFEDLGLTVWGRGIVEHHPGHKPLSNVPVDNVDGWYIGLTHGYCVERELQSFSSLITPEEIISSEFDYLALGHVHVFSVMNHGVTTAVYPGSPNSNLGVNEMSAALVELDPERGVAVSKYELSPRPS